MAAAAPSPLLELISLAHEPSSQRRRELLRRVTDLFLSAPARAPTEAQAFDAVFCTLAKEVELEVRAELSARFSDAPSAPTELAARLARDCIEVALPILSNARLLGEADLLDIARTRGQEHLRVVSGRPGLSEAVSEVIVERGDDETLGVLVRNETARLSRRASERVVERAAANPDLHAAVVGRASLPLDLVNEMYLVVEASLRDRIRARNASVDPKALDAALKLARTRMDARSGEAGAEFAEAEAEGRKARQPQAVDACGPARPAALRPEGALHRRPRIPGRGRNRDGSHRGGERRLRRHGGDLQGRRHRQIDVPDLRGHHLWRSRRDEPGRHLRQAVRRTPRATPPSAPCASGASAAKASRSPRSRVNSLPL